MDNDISELLREDCSRSLRILAEENGGVGEALPVPLGSGERNLGNESFAGSFCLRLNDILDKHECIGDSDHIEND